MIKNTRFLTVYLLILITALYINLSENIEVPVKRGFREFPIVNNEWKMVSESFFDDDLLMKLRPSDYLMRSYAGPDNRRVHLYIGYHNGGKDSGEIHSPKNCLPGNGWYRVIEDNIKVGNINLIKAVYQKGEEKELFLYWFSLGGTTLTNEFALKFTQIKNSILYRRKDTAFIKISIPYESDEKQAFFIGDKFIKDFYPIFSKFLPEWKK